MELKFVLQCVYKLIQLRLNRTFMELKFGEAIALVKANERLNRTFMELKFSRRNSYARSQLV